MNYSFGNAQHIGARSSQQDAFGFSNPFDAEFVRHGGLLAVLADGMGGLSHGDEASRIALAAFLQAYKAKTERETVAQALGRSLNAANAAVCELAERHNVSGETGTTLVAAVVHSSGLEWISTGDSGLFLFRGGELVAVNTPHVYARDLDARAAAGQITPEAALADPQRESLTSFLGLPAIAHVDRSVRPLPVDPSDDIVLASDGLFKTLTPAEMAQVMAGTLQQRCDALVRAVVERHADYQDNVTVVALAARAEVPAAARAENPLAAGAENPLAATIRVAAAAEAPRRARLPWVLGAALATISIGALAAHNYAYCCIPPIDMPKPPPAPKETKK